MNLQKLKPIVPYLSIMLIVMGLLKSIIYYGYFNLPIKYFLSLSEVIMLVTDDLMFLVAFCVMPVSIIFLFLYDNVGKWNLVDYKQQAQINFGKRVLSYKYISSIVLAAGYIIIYFIRDNYFIKTACMLQSIVALLPLLLVEMKIKYDKLSKIPFPNLYWNLIIFTGIAFLSLTLMTQYQIARVTDGMYLGTTIATKDSLYISSKSSYFIGKTSDYIFIHHTKDSSNTVLPLSEVLNLNLKIKP